MTTLKCKYCGEEKMPDSFRSANQCWECYYKLAKKCARKYRMSHLKQTREYARDHGRIHRDATRAKREAHSS